MGQVTFIHEQRVNEAPSQRSDFCEKNGFIEVGKETLLAQFPIR